jgi:hypothetical protein
MTIIIFREGLGGGGVKVAKDVQRLRCQAYSSLIQSSYEQYAA